RSAEAGPPPAQGLYDPALEHDSSSFGFVVDIKGRPSHDIVVKALGVLCNLEHRGATGAEKETGDGAGILLQTPHAFLAAECAKLGLTLPDPGRYGVGMVFLPPSEHGREAIYRLFDETIRNERTLHAGHLRRLYLDLQDPAVSSAIVMVHSRFSTNTFPSWGRAHPYRYISHNGEINTLRGNINWMHARQSMMRSKLFDKDLL